jgi:hypothetical protein
MMSLLSFFFLFLGKRNPRHSSAYYYVPTE